MAGTDSTSSQLSSISKRLTDIERRLAILEGKENPTSRAKDMRAKTKPVQKRETKPIKHTYLKKTIENARRWYEKEQR